MAIHPVIGRMNGTAMRMIPRRTTPNAAHLMSALAYTVVIAGAFARRRPNMSHTKQDRHLVVGVAGGSGSGKTTVVRKIVESVGASQVTVLEHDRYYRDRADLRLEERAALNWDHPDSLETDLMVRHVRELRQGQSVEVPRYDFARYAREESEQVTPRRTIIVEGILIFADPDLRRLMDVKVFVDTDDDIRFIRRLERDTTERGRTVRSVIDQYLGTVKPMHLDFVEPSKRYADVILPQGGTTRSRSTCS